MMDLLDTILALYGPELGHVPARVICLDLQLAVVYPPSPPHDLPVAALSAVARDVIESGRPEYDVALAGTHLAASCVPLIIGGVVVGVVCAIENPAIAIAARDRLRSMPAPVAVYDEQCTRVFSNAAWDAAETPDVTDLIPRVVEAQAEVTFATGVARPFASALGMFRGVVVSLNAGGDPVGTERALADAQLANRQKDQFIAMVSHELRAPLAAMLLWEKVLRDDVLAPATRRRALDAIHESATTQSRLVADLLDVSRAISGKLHVEKTLVAIDELVASVIDGAQPFAETRGVQVVSERPPGQHHVLGDPNRLRQIFLNILTNAITCSDPGGTVTVRWAKRNETVEVSIEDTGRGIAPEVLPHVFEPFRQASPTRDAGLGLGLAIAAQLVSLHGGSLVASSAGLRQGATFRVALPLASTIGAAPVAPDQPRLGGVHVLVVDDDQRVLEALQLLLERAGAIVETAASADDGVGAVERAVPDIVLSDIAMPDGDGCSMMRRIREREAGVRRVPAVAITAHGGRRQDALDAGFDRYLTKPLDVDQLISTIVRLVHAR
jgi:signal transduction histidine kinase/CheY-like chemotaxis protein